MRPELVVGGVPVYRVDSALAWVSGLAVDADGADRAYAPRGSGLPALDHLANAGQPGDWHGIAVDERGEPYVQGPGDPAPGYYVSTTSLYDPVWPLRDPRRYVDAERVPYLAVPPELRSLGVRIGDVGITLSRQTGRSSPAIVADRGPRRRLGEGSIALAAALGLPSSPRRGGAQRGVVQVVWPGSTARPKWPRECAEVAAQVKQLLEAWGGEARLARMV